jgi:cytochrome c biogenesis protein CcdA
MLLLLISLIAGVLIILAPCVLPVLPVIIGGSISGDNKDKARPFIIGGALVVSIIFFTLILKVSTILINLLTSVLNDASGGILITLGIATVFPELWEKLVIQLNWQAASQRFLGQGEKIRIDILVPFLLILPLGQSLRAVALPMLSSWHQYCLVVFSLALFIWRPTVLA